MQKRRLSLLDKLICEADSVMKTITSRGNHASRPSPSDGHIDADLSETERKHVAGLMRVNHTARFVPRPSIRGRH
jgi:ubiquinone biosynthesis monooxygenase Coq7